ncbi:MAG: hypothetical protein KBS62_01190 [Oscillospiraceae bacterium]|nr:hypothetical protein [Candidatus Ruminococcus equi]
MASNVMSVVKGVTFGMASGIVVGFVGKKMLDDGKYGLKRKANRAIDTMEDIAETAKYIFR